MRLFRGNFTLCFTVFVGTIDPHKLNTPQHTHSEFRVEFDCILNKGPVWDDECVLGVIIAAGHA